MKREFGWFRHPFCVLAAIIGPALLASGCGSVPSAVSKPLKTAQQLPSKLVPGNKDAELAKKAEADPFPTPRQAGAKVVAEAR
jgi:hypothetical protein